MEQPLPVRTTRRSRPSLAAFADSGYEPSRPIQKFTLRSRRNTTSSVGNDCSSNSTPRTLGDIFSEPVTYRIPHAATVRGPPPMSQSMRPQQRASYPFTYDGEAAGTINGGTIRMDSVSKGSNSSGYPARTGTISRSATISSAWSGVSNRLFMESVLGPTNDKDMNEFTEQFDRLAKKHGIQPFPRNFKAEPTSVSVSSATPQQSSGESTPTLRGNRLWNRLLGRTPSTVDVSKHHGNIKMTLTKRRHNDVSDLAAIGKGKRDSLKGMHLEDMIRLGGVAIFNLPLGLAPGDLLIPTCIHAAASFLMNNGLKTPGIFRVSGNSSTVYALYDHYQKQLEENNNGAVVATTALARLPAHIPYNIHDVAHLFRKLLHGLPGGLLGSPAVFQALYNVHRFVYPDPSLGEEIAKKVKPRMIALALSSINLHFRISLICAVFGLLRAITLASEQEAEIKVKDPFEMFTRMREDSLGIVFGPLLLGDKSEHILTEDPEDRGGLLVLASMDQAPKVGPKDSKRKWQTSYSKKQLEKTRRAAMVCQMMIDDWEDICYQMKRINTLGATAEAYDLPAQTQVQEEFKYMYEDPRKSVREDGKQTIRSRPGTLRSSTRRGAKQRPALDLPADFQPRMHTHRIPDPPFENWTFEPPQADYDLMDFSHGSMDEDLESTAGPFVAEKAYRPPMTPIGELTPINMTPIKALQSPPDPQAFAPDGSPNWKLIDPTQVSEPATPVQKYEVKYREPPMRADFLQHSSSGGLRGQREPTLARQGSAESKRSISTDSGNIELFHDPSASPPMEMTPQAAIRPRLNITLGPPFEESPKSLKSLKEELRREEELRKEEELRRESPEPLDDPDDLETDERRTTFGRRAISPVPELSPPQNIVDPDDDDDDSEEDRPITPKPLSFRKKGRGSPFSIYEDGRSDRSGRMSTSPVLTLTKPNTHTDIKLTLKGIKPAPNSPPHPLQPATPNRKLEADFEDRYVFDPESETRSPGKLKGNSALYAEIRRLQKLVDQKNEEALQTRRELELAKSMANAGTLSQLVRETQDELKVWRNRAEWAEKQLRERGMPIRQTGSVRGHAKRYSIT